VAEHNAGATMPHCRSSLGDGWWHGGCKTAGPHHWVGNGMTLGHPNSGWNLTVFLALFRGSQVNKGSTLTIQPDANSFGLQYSPSFLC